MIILGSILLTVFSFFSHPTFSADETVDDTIEVPHDDECLSILKKFEKHIQPVARDAHKDFKHSYTCLLGQTSNPKAIASCKRKQAKHLRDIKIYKQLLRKFRMEMATEWASIQPNQQLNRLCIFRNRDGKVQINKSNSRLLDISDDLACKPILTSWVHNLDRQETKHINEKVTFGSLNQDEMAILKNFRSSALLRALSERVKSQNGISKTAIKSEAQIKLNDIQFRTGKLVEKLDRGLPDHKLYQLYAFKTQYNSFAMSLGSKAKIAKYCAENDGFLKDCFGFGKNRNTNLSGAKCSTRTGVFIVEAVNPIDTWKKSELNQAATESKLQTVEEGAEKAGDLGAKTALSSVALLTGISGTGAKVVSKTIGLTKQSRVVPNNLRNDYSSTVQNAENTLGKKLSEVEKFDIYQAHKIGSGEIGKDGTLARVNNYKFDQMKRKAKSLKNAGIDKTARRELFEAGVVGESAPELSGLPGGSEISIQSLSGNLYSGKYVGVENYKGDQVVKLIKADGQEQILRVSKLDLSSTTLRGPPGISVSDEIRILSKSGKPYYGKYGGIEVQDGELVVKLIKPDGKMQILRANRLDLSSATARGPPQVSTRSVQNSLQTSQNQIDQIAPKLKLAENGDVTGGYYGNGYWKQWAGSELDDLPPQGWKLHVSATPHNAGDIAQAVIPVLQKNNIPHKIIEKVALYNKIGTTDPSQAGKFITVYPKNAEEARHFAKLVNDVIKSKGYSNKDFIPVPGEDSVGIGVFARYGRITKDDLIGSNGQKIPGTKEMLLTPDNKLIDDIRGSARPHWVRPLFGN